MAWGGRANCFLARAAPRSRAGDQTPRCCRSRAGRGRPAPPPAARFASGGSRHVVATETCLEWRPSRGSLTPSPRGRGPARTDLPQQRAACPHHAAPGPREGRGGAETDPRGGITAEGGGTRLAPPLGPPRPGRSALARARARSRAQCARSLFKQRGCDGSNGCRNWETDRLLFGGVVLTSLS